MARVWVDTGRGGFWRETDNTPRQWVNRGRSGSGWNGGTGAIDPNDTISLNQQASEDRVKKQSEGNRIAAPYGGQQSYMAHLYSTGGMAAVKKAQTDYFGTGYWGEKYEEKNGTLFYTPPDPSQSPQPSGWRRELHKIAPIAAAAIAIYATGGAAGLWGAGAAGAGGAGAASGGYGGGAAVGATTATVGSGITLGTVAQTASAASALYGYTESSKASKAAADALKRDQGATAAILEEDVPTLPSETSGELQQLRRDTLRKNSRRRGRANSILSDATRQPLGA